MINLVVVTSTSFNTVNGKYCCNGIGSFEETKTLKVGFQYRKR